MKKFLFKNAALILALIMICSVCLLFCTRKEGMFIDEIYSYGLSNSFYAPYVTDLKGGDMTDTVFTREELNDYLVVTGEDAFAVGSVYYNQACDVHPPLYYWLLNFVCSLFPGEFTMWTGLILGLVIYLASLVMLYKLALLLFDSRLAAVAGVMMYGLSTIGLSTMLMIRMYVLLTLFTVILAYLIARLHTGGGRGVYVLIALTIFAGLMTQYYFVFYAFFVCASYDIYLFTRREWRAAAAFSAAALIGVAGLVVAFPACFDQLFADKLVSGGNAVENLKSVWQYAERMRVFIADSAHRMKGIIYPSALYIIACAVSGKKIAALWRADGAKLFPLVLVLPAFAAFILIAIISPVAEIRYVYNLVPIFVLAACMPLSLLERAQCALFERRHVSALVGLIVAALCLFEARAIAPDYLYDEYSDYDALLTPHCGAPCVYIDDNYFSPITYDMLQLMLFDDFLVTNDTESEAMLDYIGSAGEAVVFVDISKQWASGYDDDEVIARLCESTGLPTAEALYSNGFSAVYLLTQGG